MYQKLPSKCTRSRCLATLMIVTILFFMTHYIPEKRPLSIMSASDTINNSNTLIPSLLSRLETVENTHSRKTEKSGAKNYHRSVIHEKQKESDIKNYNRSVVHYKQKESYIKSYHRSELIDRKRVVEISKMHKVKEVNCQALFSGDRIETERAKGLARNVGRPLDDLAYMNLTSDCQKFQSERGYIMSPLSEEEENFPLAYSMLVFKDSEMVERLLRAIYRPQNYYCLHVDKKSTDDFHNVMKRIANCFPNVFVASRRIDIQWAWFSVLEPELLCMEELWKYPDWKYFMTLTGQEFPLKTNFELVKIFTVYDGANDLEGTVKRANFERWRTTPPFGIHPIKGSVHITVNRDYVDYVLHNNTAKVLLEWVKRDTSFPDETFFATLNHNPQLGIRGSYKGEPETDEETKPFLTRYKNWGHLPCASGNYVRAICILSLGDLPLLGQAKHYFANKFYLWEDRAVIGCLEEKIFNDTRDEYLGQKAFDVSYYAGLGFVKNKV